MTDDALSSLARWHATVTYRTDAGPLDVPMCARSGISMTGSSRAVRGLGDNHQNRTFKRAVLRAPTVPPPHEGAAQT